MRTKLPSQASVHWTTANIAPTCLVVCCPPRMLRCREQNGDADVLSETKAILRYVYLTLTKVGDVSSLLSLLDSR